MADKKTTKAPQAAKPTKKRVIKKTETIREKANKKVDAPTKPKRLSKVKSVVAKPVKAAKNIGKKEYHPVKLPDNKVGRFMTKKRRIIPKFFREAWAELKQVVWPTRKETAKLTLAVFVFAITFGAIIAVVDFALDKIFKQLLFK